MKKQTRTQEKKLKMAEAGIFFVLVLGVLVFVGVHFSGQDAEVATTAARTPTVEPLPVTRSAPVSEPEPVVIEVAETATPEPEPLPEPLPEPEPAPVEVTYTMAEQAYFDGDYSRAVELFNVYTDEHGANAWGFYMLGLSQWKAGQADVAEESFLAALELKPDHQKSLINYGRVLIDLGRPDEAREQIEIALAANPESRSARRVLGRIQHNLGDLGGAEQTYLVLLRHDRDDAWALNNLGLIRIEQERYADAIAPLARAAALRSDQACFENNLGVALERCGHHGAAGEAFARALAIDAGYEKAEISLARVENLMGTEEETIDVAALAESFSVGEPAAPEAEDMEVAAAGPILLDNLEEIEEPATTEVVEPEADGHRNR